MTFAEASVLPRMKRQTWTGFYVRNKDSMLVWIDSAARAGDGAPHSRERPFTPTEIELAATDWEIAADLSTG